MPQISIDASISSDQAPSLKVDMSSSGIPPSMGPGARPIVPGGPAASGSNVPTTQELDSVIAQVREIRSHYSIALDDARSRLDIAYDLNRHRAMSIPFDKMPLGSAAQWLLYGGVARRATTGTFVIDIIRGAEKMAQRDLTQTEAEGHACHASRRMLYSFAAVISATTIGAGFAVAGKKTMKFPLRKPQPLERYDNFPNRYLPILRGQYARAMWHITRANVYTFCAFLLLSPLYSSMGDNAMTVGLYRDSRTNGVLKEMKANQDPNRAFQLSRIGSNVERGSKENRGQVFAQTAAQREKLEQQRGQVVYEDPDPQGYYNDSGDNPPNDYSGSRSYEPNAESQASYDESTGNTTLQDGTILTDQQMQQASARAAPGSFTGNPAYQKGRQQRMQQQQQQQEDETRDKYDDGADGFLFDDASPTGGRGFSEDTAPPSPEQSVLRSGVAAPGYRLGTGGAWNRVRKGEQTAHAASKPGEPQKPSSRGSSADSFSFSKSDEERQWAKDQAQRDFDRMVEAERKGQGSDGYSPGGTGGAWGRGGGTGPSGNL